jgi:pyrroline-5-carboxylate reductase
MTRNLAALEGDVALVGCGKMGGAMLAGWLARGLPPSRVRVVEPAPEHALAVLGPGRGRIVPDAADLPDGMAPAAIVLAVKPQMMEAVLPACARLAGAGTLVLSIAAGKTIRGFEAAFGPGAAIVRAMPNTPAAIGRGISVAVANASADADQRALADALLQAAGEVAWVEDEGLIDPVTAVSGGGPAYVFLLIEALAEAGVAAGLPADLSMRLARVTVSGAGELARQSPEPAAQLRKNVTSPNGTTERALAVLMGEGGLTPLMTRAVAAATARSRELGS